MTELTQPKPSVEDPKTFFHDFRKSAIYKNAYNDFFSGKKLTPDVTEEDKIGAFESSEKAKIALMNFGEEDTTFHFDPTKFSPKSLEAIEEYLKIVREQQSADIQEGADIEALDLKRSLIHQQAAFRFVQDGIVQNEKLGRALARLILVDAGLSSYESAKVPDIVRIKRQNG